MHRRIAMRLMAACGLVGLVGQVPVQAQDWPTKPVKIVVPFPAGGAGDVVPRIIGRYLAPEWGQAVVVENKAGADGLIGVDAVAKASADGYTLGVATSGPVVIGKRLFPQIPYDPANDLVPVVLTYETPFVLVVPTSSPIKTMAELIVIAKKNPGKLNIAIPNSGSVQHLLTEQMKGDTGIFLANIPYKGGGPAATAVMAGEVDLTWGALPNVVAQVKAGRMRAIAVSGSNRSPLLPDVPTVREQGWAGLTVTNWNGLIAPRGTPDAVIAKMNRDINAILVRPDVVKQFTDMGITPLGGSRAQFAALIKEEEAKWDKVIRVRSIKPE